MALFHWKSCYVYVQVLLIMDCCGVIAHVSASCNQESSLDLHSSSEQGHKLIFVILPRKDLSTLQSCLRWLKYGTGFVSVEQLSTCEDNVSIRNAYGILFEIRRNVSILHDYIWCDGSLKASTAYRHSTESGLYELVCSAHGTDSRGQELSWRVITAWDSHHSRVQYSLTNGKEPTGQAVHNDRFDDAKVIQIFIALVGVLLPLSIFNICIIWILYYCLRRKSNWEQHNSLKQKGQIPSVVPIHHRRVHSLGSLREIKGEKTGQMQKMTSRISVAPKNYLALNHQINQQTLPAVANLSSIRPILHQTTTQLDSPSSAPRLDKVSSSEISNLLPLAVTESREEKHLIQHNELIIDQPQHSVSFIRTPPLESGQPVSEEEERYDPGNPPTKPGKQVSAWTTGVKAEVQGDLQLLPKTAVQETGDHHNGLKEFVVDKCSEEGTKETISGDVKVALFLSTGQRDSVRRFDDLLTSAGWSVSTYMSQTPSQLKERLEAHAVSLSDLEARNPVSCSLVVIETSEEDAEPLEEAGWHENDPPGVTITVRAAHALRVGIPMFSNGNCPSLFGWSRIFLLQACKPDREPTTYEVETCLSKKATLLAQNGGLSWQLGVYEDSDDEDRDYDDDDDGDGYDRHISTVSSYDDDSGCCNHEADRGIVKRPIRVPRTPYYSAEAQIPETLPEGEFIVGFSDCPVYLDGMMEAASEFRGVPLDNLLMRAQRAAWSYGRDRPRHDSVDPSSWYRARVYRDYPVLIDEEE